MLEEDAVLTPASVVRSCSSMIARMGANLGSQLPAMSSLKQPHQAKKSQLDSDSDALNALYRTMLISPW